MTSHRFLFLLVAVCILISTNVNGQVRVGNNVVPDSTAVMLPSLPTGLYCSEATQTITLDASEQMRVIALHTLRCAVVLPRTYAEVERISALPNDPQRRGFIRDPDRTLKVVN